MDQSRLFRHFGVRRTGFTGAFSASFVGLLAFGCRQATESAPAQSAATHSVFGRATLAASQFEIGPTSASAPPGVARELHLGRAAAGSRVDHQIFLRNTGAQPIRIAHCQSTCECLSVSELPLMLGPRETGSLMILLDMGREPEFVGELAATFRLLGDRGETVAGVVVVDVRPADIESLSAEGNQPLAPIAELPDPSEQRAFGGDS